MGDRPALSQYQQDGCPPEREARKGNTPSRILRWPGARTVAPGGATAVVPGAVPTVAPGSADALAAGGVATLAAGGPDHQAGAPPSTGALRVAKDLQNSGRIAGQPIHGKEDRLAAAGGGAHVLRDLRQQPGIAVGTDRPQTNKRENTPMAVAIQTGPCWVLT